VSRHTPASTTSERVGGHFRKKAASFDALYDEDGRISRRLRPGLVRRRELAVEAVRSHANPRVLDVGCGSGRIGELVLDAGAAEYLGVDLAAEMLDLARARLARFGERVTLVQGDFLELPTEEPFDVVLGLGLFDYLREPETFATRIGALCSGSAVASFPAWHWLKGPIRKLRYEVLSDCPIFDYTEPQIRALFTHAGFTHVEVHAPGRAGFLMRADHCLRSDRDSGGAGI
jgi:2-polyprenyl-3-methyl-5-hydroxy-6-metoxy-1,4-benzoquinol methylase